MITFINQPEISQYQAMRISVWPNPERLSDSLLLAQIYEEIRKESPPENLSSFNQPITVGGQPAIKTTVFSSSGSTYAFHILIPNGDRAYLTGPTYAAMGGTQVHPQSITQFYEILETFAIISSNP